MPNQDLPAKNLYLVTTFDAEGKETERLVSAEKRSQAVGHVVKLNVASAADVVRVMGKGGKVEESLA